MLFHLADVLFIDIQLTSSMPLPPWHHLEDNDIEMDKISMNTTTIFASAVEWTNSMHKYF